MNGLILTLRCFVRGKKGVGGSDNVEDKLGPEDDGAGATIERKKEI